MQAKKHHFLKQISAVVILAIFSLAITPWSVLHHHEEVVPVHEKNCKHTVHVKSATEHCLICEAHFEKNYTASYYNYNVQLKVAFIKINYPVVGTPFTEIIATCLRGPPTFS